MVSANCNDSWGNNSSSRVLEYHKKGLEVSRNARANEGLPQICTIDKKCHFIIAGASLNVVPT